MTTREMLTLGSMATTMPHDRVVTLQLNDVNGLYGEQLFKGGLLYAPPRTLLEDAFVLLPVSIPEFPVTWKQVHMLSRLLFRERALYLAHPTIAVLNAGAKEGSARKIAGEFTKFGFEVAHVANFPGKQEFPHSFIMDTGSDPAEIKVTEFFSSLFSLKQTSLPAVLAGNGATSADTKNFGTVTIVLGKEYAFRPFQDLLPESKPQPKP